MSNATKPTIAQAVTPELLASLIDEKYILPQDWPAGALAAVGMDSEGGWTLDQKGEGTVYVAPDGARFIRLARTEIPVLVGLSKKRSPVNLGVEPGADYPAWLPSAKEARKARAKAAKNGTGEAKVRALNVSDAELESILGALLDNLGDVGQSAAVKSLRAEGRKVSGGRVRRIYKALIAQRPKLAQAKKSATKQETAKGKAKPAPKATKRVTRAVPKPSAAKKGSKKAKA